LANAWRQSQLPVCILIDGARFVFLVIFDAEYPAAGERGCTSIQEHGAK
jgi:hypothetical protein